MAFEHGWFKMPYLDKPEWVLLTQLQAIYELKDARETIAVAIRLMDELSTWGTDNQGDDWIIRIIDEYRSTPRRSR